MLPIHRRGFVAALATSAAALHASASPGDRPRLGVVVDVTEKSADAAIARVHNFGLSTCQVAVKMSPEGLAAPLKAALEKYNVEATAAMTLGQGRMVWDFYEGPKTIGLVPPETRVERIAALKRASDLAAQCGIKAVHTHCGFIPEDPNSPTYPEIVAAIQQVAGYCKSNGQTFLMETGQETPITLLRAIRDTQADNIGVNLDVANLILYGKGEPVGALDVIGPLVRGMHAKDGMYPTDPKRLGEEVPIGEGRVNFREVIRKLHALHYTGPITIERETSGTQQEADIRASIRYLQNLIEESYH